MDEPSRKKNITRTREKSVSRRQKGDEIGRMTERRNGKPSKNRKEKKRNRETSKRTDGYGVVALKKEKKRKKRKKKEKKRKKRKLPTPGIEPGPRR